MDETPEVPPLEDDRVAMMLGLVPDKRTPEERLWDAVRTNGESLKYHYQRKAASKAMQNPLEDDSRWTVRGDCGMPYLGENRHLRGTKCVHYAGHGGPHRSPEGRYWATPGQS